MILITTAGKVGSAAAHTLGDRQVPVRIVSRDPHEAEELTRVGVAVVQGDLTVPASLDQALHGVTSVVLVSPAVPADERNVVDAAVRAGVDHVVTITSKSSADSPIARRRDQHAIEAALIGYTLLRNNAYMQNLLMLARSIAQTDSFGSSTGEGRIGARSTPATRERSQPRSRHHPLGAHAARVGQAAREASPTQMQQQRSHASSAV